MKRVKQILNILVVLVALVPMTVFAGGGKFLADYYDEDSYSHIKLTNYKGKASELPNLMQVVRWDEESEKNGEYDEEFDMNPDDYELEDTAVTTGKTTLTMEYGKKTDGGVLVYPVLSQTKSGILFVGEPKEYHGGKASNVSIVLEPGEYLIDFYTAFEGDAWETIYQGYIKVEGGKSIPVDKKPVAKEPAAMPTSSKVLVNNKQVSFEAYTIESSNYIKLRDFAYAVTGTDKQFEVGWDADKGAINLVSNAPYNANGTELAKGNGKAKSTVLNKAAIYQDGAKVDLKAYTIDGNNYFKLRDLADAFDIVVTWDEATSTIGIDTSL